MPEKMIKKTWLSPAIAVLFFFVATTGILLFMDIHNGPIMTLHEWLGLTFVGAGIIHLWMNWKVFAAYFRKKTPPRP